jgi:hypothetical protein
MYMKKRETWLILGMSAFAASVLIMSIILIMGAFRAEPGPQAAYDLGPKSAFVRIDSPRPSDYLTSPFTVRGAARTWYFEGSFPVELKDANGITIASGIAQAKGDWMTDQMVPFEAALNFPKPSTSVGTLILKKDNPSGLPQYDDQVQVEVRFGN